VTSATCPSSAAIVSDLPSLRCQSGGQIFDIDIEVIL
jgi:hypothetical protein